MKSKLVYGIKVKLNCADPTEAIRRDLDEDEGREEHDRIRDIIFAAKPDGFEVCWLHRDDQWVTDKKGFTFVPLVITYSKDNYARLVDQLCDAREEIGRITDLAKQICRQ